MSADSAKEQPEVAQWNQLGKAARSVMNLDTMHAEDVPKGRDWNHPHRGIEDQYVDYRACDQAYSAFPQLRQLDPTVGPPAINRDLIAAMIRNEQFYYTQIKDTAPISTLTSTVIGPFEKDNSIGAAQVQVGNIEQLAQQYPQQLGDSNNIIGRAEQPATAALIVGAYLDDVVSHIKNNTRPDYIGKNAWLKVNQFWCEGKRDEALIMAFNPDPHQVAHVTAQLRQIRTNGHD